MPPRRTRSGSGASFGKGNSCLYVLLVLGIIGFWVLLYGWWDTNHFDVRKTEIALERLPAAFDGFTILQVSDLHNRAYGRDGLALENAIRHLSFDMVAITGDLLDRHLPRRRKNGYALVEAVTGRVPVYFVQGNHEWEIGAWEATKAELIQRNVTVLDDNGVSIWRDGSKIDLCGIMEKTALEDIRRLLAGDSFKLLLAHHPERLEEYAVAGADLVLSGHAHGGHVRLFGQGLYSPDQGVLPRFTSGIYTCDKTKLYVSRGAGNHSFLPPRIFNRPEIDLITLKTPSR